MLFVDIPANQASLVITGNAVPDVEVEGDETLVVTLAAGPYTIDPALNTTTITIVDNVEQAGPLVNGANHNGQIATSHEVDVWTFSGAAGDAVTLSIGEVGGNSAFTPWIRLRRPDGVQIATAFGAQAAQINVTLTVSGTFTVAVASADSGNNDTGSYALTLAHTPGAAPVVSADDEGGALLNGANHTGTIHRRRLDQWTFTASAGARSRRASRQDRRHHGFQPWMRIRAPNGALLGRTSAAYRASDGDRHDGGRPTRCW